jgi:hypothetical protein
MKSLEGEKVLDFPHVIQQRETSTSLLVIRAYHRQPFLPRIMKLL